MLCFWLTEQPPSRAPHPEHPPGEGLAVRPSRLLCYAFAACCALGVLTKGLIGVVFPIAIVAIYLLLTRGLRGTISRVLRTAPILGHAGLPRHRRAVAHAGRVGKPDARPSRRPRLRSHGHCTRPAAHQGNVHGWAWFYFVNEQVLRYLNLRVPRDYDTVPLWLFWGLMPHLAHAVVAFLFKALGALKPAHASRRRWRAEAPFASGNLAFAICGRCVLMLLLVIWGCAAAPVLLLLYAAGVLRAACPSAANYLDRRLAGYRILRRSVGSRSRKAQSESASQIYAAPQ